MTRSTGQSVLVLVGDDYEDLELWYPKLRLEAQGVAAPTAGLAASTDYRGKHGYPCRSDLTVAEVTADNYTGILIPGGWMPDKLRRDPHVLELVRAFDAAQKMIATICHGPWINISAGICRGVRMTSTPGIKDDLANAGAVWSDEPVVVDRHHISSRRPPDLPVFAEAMIRFLSERG